MCPRSCGRVEWSALLGSGGWGDDEGYAQHALLFLDVQIRSLNSKSGRSDWGPTCPSPARMSELLLSSTHDLKRLICYYSHNKFFLYFRALSTVDLPRRMELRSEASQPSQSTRPSKWTGTRPDNTIFGSTVERECGGAAPLLAAVFDKSTNTLGRGCGRSQAHLAAQWG